MSNDKWIRLGPTIIVQKTKKPKQNSLLNIIVGQWWIEPNRFDWPDSMSLAIQVLVSNLEHDKDQSTNQCFSLPSLQAIDLTNVKYARNDSHWRAISVPTWRLMRSHRTRSVSAVAATIQATRDWSPLAVAPSVTSPIRHCRWHWRPSWTVLDRDTTSSKLSENERKKVFEVFFRNAAKTEEIQVNQKPILNVLAILFPCPRSQYGFTAKIMQEFSPVKRLEANPWASSSTKHRWISSGNSFCVFWSLFPLFTCIRVQPRTTPALPMLSILNHHHTHSHTPTLTHPLWILLFVMSR